MTENTIPNVCSFCGSVASDEVHPLICSELAPNTFICYDCVSAFSDIYVEHRVRLGLSSSAYSSGVFGSNNN